MNLMQFILKLKKKKWKFRIHANSLFYIIINPKLRYCTLRSWYKWKECNGHLKHEREKCR
jgi:hypothetical protein